jgi:hypothetical protein
MAGYKLSRMKDATWNPPILEFTIERHGGTALGSTRASLQRWEINMDCERRVASRITDTVRFTHVNPR